MGNFYIIFGRVLSARWLIAFQFIAFPLLAMAKDSNTFGALGITSCHSDHKEKSGFSSGKIIQVRSVTSVVDGIISANEYGNHTDGQNQQSTATGTWLMNWDASNLYIGISGTNTTQGAVLYLDTDPILPVNGGGNGNGNNSGFNYDGSSFAALQFRADIVLYFRDTYREYRKADGANNWGPPTSGMGTYGSTFNIREISIPWSVITGGGMPAAFNWFGYVAYAGGGAYASVPTENPGSGGGLIIGNAARWERYYTVSNTAIGSETKPFSRNSYVFNNTVDETGFNGISVYDFTMNTSGRAITRGSGIWNIGGNFRVDSGTVNFGATVNPANVSGNLTIGTGGTLNLSSSFSGDLYITGNWDRSATGVFNPNERAVFFNGSGKSVITAPAGEWFSYLFMIKNALTDSISLNNKVSVTRILGLISGTLDLKGSNVILVSDSSGTASFSKLGNGIPANASIYYSGTGRFTVERYIPKTHPKAWQFLAVPTTDQTVNAAWQEGNAPMVIGTQGLGTLISSNVAGTGFDIIGGVGPSMKTYDTTGSGSWKGIRRTDTALYNSKGYMLFVRGDRTVSSSGAAATATKLRSTGKLFEPNSNPPPVISIGAGKFESIGNPYASAINFRLLGFTGGVQPDFFYVWDPKLGTIGPNSAFGLGGFQSFSWNGTNFDVTPGGGSYAGSNRNIESGQAFFAKTVGSPGTISFTEACKVDGSANVNRVGAAPVKQLRTNLNVISETDNFSVLLDGNLVQFDRLWSNRVDKNDGFKLLNSGENLGISREGRLLAVERRGQMEQTDTLFFQLSQVKVREYELEFIPENLGQPGWEAFLVDRYLRTTYAVSLSQTNRYPFRVTPDAASAATGRFYLVFRKTKKQLPLAALHSFSGKNAYPVMDPGPEKSAGGIYIFPNPVENRTMKVEFFHQPGGKYILSLTNQLRQLVYQRTIYLETGNSVQNIPLCNEVPGGVYRLSILAPDGKNLLRQVIIKQP